MLIDILTLFPQVFPGPLGVGVVGRALEQGLIELRPHDLRPFGLGVHRQVDDIPFGGGPGMVLRPEPLFAAIRSLEQEAGEQPVRRILLAAHGAPLSAATAAELAHSSRLLLVCGRYEGVDERVAEAFQMDQISVGDFVVSGGELPAMLLVEAVARQLPGVLGDPRSAEDESFSSGLPEYPHYTRPAVFEGMEVPEVLRSGDHARIARWRAEAALERARRWRPDLLSGGTGSAREGAELSGKQKRGVEAIGAVVEV